MSGDGEHQEPCGGIPGGCLGCIGLYHRYVGSVVPWCVLCDSRHWAYEDHDGEGLVSEIARHAAAVEKIIRPTSYTDACPLCKGSGIYTFVPTPGPVPNDV